MAFGLCHGLCHDKWYTFCFVKVKVKVDPEVKVRSHPLSHGLSCASTLMPFTTSYLHLIRIYCRKTLMTQNDPCDAICDVTRSKNAEIRYEDLPAVHDNIGL